MDRVKEAEKGLSPRFSIHFSTEAVLTMAD